jgi:phosphomevalonate kinase
MDSSAYKETYRKAMIVWGEEMRTKDPGYFCRLATREADKPVWLVCDARRTTDMDYFKLNYGECTITVKVVASEAVRVGRGWVFMAGVDDAESECGLDDYTCDVVITNNGDDTIYSANDAINSNSEAGVRRGTLLREQLETVVKMVKGRLPKKASTCMSDC